MPEEEVVFYSKYAEEEGDKKRKRTENHQRCPETLGEPVKLREAEAKENAKLTDFQGELVQMAATLNGDHKNDTYPHKLVENMTVLDAAKYCVNAFKEFLDQHKEATAKADHIAKGSMVPGDANHIPVKTKSFANRFFSCLVCGGGDSTK